MVGIRNPPENGDENPYTCILSECDMTHPAFPLMVLRLLIARETPILPKNLEAIRAYLLYLHEQIRLIEQLKRRVEKL